MTLIDDLVNYYKLDIDADDSVGSDDGVVTGATLVTGIINDCYSFTGTPDKIDMGDITTLDGATKMSIQAWIKTSASFGGNKTIFGKVHTVFSNFRLRIESTNKVRWAIDPAVGSALTNVAVNDGVWHHLVGTYDNSLGSANLKLYVDGVLQTQTGNDTQAIPNTTDRLGIGASIDSVGATTEYFEGLIDELGLWEKVLSQADVTKLYNSGAGIGYPLDFIETNIDKTIIANIDSTVTSMRNSSSNIWMMTSLGRGQEVLTTNIKEP